MVNGKLIAQNVVDYRGRSSGAYSNAITADTANANKAGYEGEIQAEPIPNPEEFLSPALRLGRSRAHALTPPKFPRRKFTSS